MTTKTKSLEKISKPDTEHPRISVTTHQATTHLQNANEILGVQRGAGNLAIQRLLQSGMIQAKLTIGQPGDQYEQEADRVAEQVMLMPEPDASEKAAVSGQGQGTHIQRVCSECEEKEMEELLQTKENPGHTPVVNPGMESHIQALKDGGQPLLESVRGFFEPRFGYEFSQVRIHTDSKAADSARGINALAYTIGQDIVFGAGQYAPESTAGKRLLAHELAHVVQQQVAGTPAVQTQGPTQAELEKACDCGAQERDMDSKKLFMNNAAADLEASAQIVAGALTIIFFACNPASLASGVGIAACAGAVAALSAAKANFDADFTKVNQFSEAYKAAKAAHQDCADKCPIRPEEG